MAVSAKMEFCFIIILIMTLSFYATSFVYANSIANESTEWILPFGVGNILKIECLDGSFVDMVEDCPAADTCKSLKFVNESVLECSKVSLVD